MNDKIIQVTVRMTQSQLKALKHAAIDDNKTMGDYIIIAINDKLAKDKGEVK